MKLRSTDSGRSDRHLDYIERKKLLSQWLTNFSTHHSQLVALLPPSPVSDSLGLWYGPRICKFPDDADDAGLRTSAPEALFHTFLLVLGDSTTLQRQMGDARGTTPFNKASKDKI